jgi:hypothetical protein
MMGNTKEFHLIFQQENRQWTVENVLKPVLLVNKKIKEV